MCVGCLTDAVAADACGADRIELSSALEVDGVSPSFGLVEAVLHRVRAPVVVLVRSRSGGFVYESDEIEVMAHDARRYASMGAAGVAVGALTKDCQLDRVAMESMAQAARVGQGEIHLVCHRAFDQTVDQTSTLHMLEGLGFHRVLTSGGASTALQGAAKIRSLQKSTSLDLVPAGGVNASSIVEVVSKTGCRSVHGTFRNQSGGSGTGIRMSVSELRGAMKITGHGATGT